MSTDDRTLADDPGDPRDPADDPDADADEMLGVKPDDEVIPASPGGRRRAILIALVFLGAMIVFWVLFIATHTGTGDGDGMLGWGGGKCWTGSPDCRIEEISASRIL
jgi:hypothetical protein